MTIYGKEDEGAEHQIKLADDRRRAAIDRVNQRGKAQTGLHRDDLSGHDEGLDQKFKEALSKVTHYQVYGKTLKLLDRHGNLLIQFETPTAAR